MSSAKVQSVIKNLVSKRLTLARKVITATGGNNDNLGKNFHNHRSDGTHQFSCGTLLGDHVHQTNSKLYLRFYRRLGCRSGLGDTREIQSKISEGSMACTAIVSSTEVG